MRRMYSEQELTKVIGDVVDSKIEDGSFDDAIAEYVDEYLVEHPVDITALEGKTIAPANVNATGSITANSIIENMVGYSFSPVSNEHIEIDFAGSVKNGNKLTLAFAGLFKGGDAGISANTTLSIGYPAIPSSIGEKLIPIAGTILDLKKATIGNSFSTLQEATFATYKPANTYLDIKVFFNEALEANAEKAFRYEVTFLLSDNLVSE